MKTEKLELNGRVYTCQQLPARLGLQVASKLANALAPAVKALPEEGFEMNDSQLAAFIEPILSNPELNGTLQFLCSTFAERTIVDTVNANGQEVQFPLGRIFDDHFADSYDDLIAWLVFSLKLSLSSFFRSVRGLVASQKAKTELASKSPNLPATSGPAGA